MWVHFAAILAGAAVIVVAAMPLPGVRTRPGVYLSSALIDGEVWLRPCFVNFRTTEEDVLALLEVTREVGAKLAAG